MYVIIIFVYYNFFLFLPFLLETEEGYSIAHAFYQLFAMFICEKLLTFNIFKKLTYTYLQFVNWQIRWPLWKKKTKPNFFFRCCSFDWFCVFDGFDNFYNVLFICTTARIEQSCFKLLVYSADSQFYGCPCAFFHSLIWNLVACGNGLLPW